MGNSWSRKKCNGQKQETKKTSNKPNSQQTANQQSKIQHEFADKCECCDRIGKEEKKSDETVGLLLMGNEYHKDDINGEIAAVSKRYGFCTATLIHTEKNRALILSAAHCVRQYSYDEKKKIFEITRPRNVRWCPGIITYKRSSATAKKIDATEQDDKDEEKERKPMKCYQVSKAYYLKNYNFDKKEWIQGHGAIHTPSDIAIYELLLIDYNYPKAEHSKEFTFSTHREIQPIKSHNVGAFKFGQPLTILGYPHRKKENSDTELIKWHFDLDPNSHSYQNAYKLTLAKWNPKSEIDKKIYASWNGVIVSFNLCCEHGASGASIFNKAGKIVGILVNSKFNEQALSDTHYKESLNKDDSEIAVRAFIITDYIFDLLIKPVLTSKLESKIYELSLVDNKRLSLEIGSKVMYWKKHFVESTIETIKYDKYGGEELMLKSDLDENVKYGPTRRFNPDLQLIPDTVNKAESLLMVNNLYPEGEYYGIYGDYDTFESFNTYNGYNNDINVFILILSFILFLLCCTISWCVCYTLGIISANILLSVGAKKNKNEEINKYNISNDVI